MEETVYLKPSRSQAIGLFMIYLLILFASLAVITSLPFLVLTLVILGLYAADDWSKNQADHLQLTINRDGTINLGHLDAQTCYPECRMYYNRWCMVVKLKNKVHSRSIILTADRFENVDAYARTRHHLLRLEEEVHAA